MVQMTEKAIGKVKEIMSSQEPAPAGLRIAVVGGGCSGFSYSMAFENQPNMLDKTYDYDGLEGLRRSGQPAVSGWRRGRLRGNAGGRGLQVQQPPGEIHLRLRQFLPGLNCAPFFGSRRTFAFACFHLLPQLSLSIPWHFYAAATRPLRIGHAFRAEPPRLTLDAAGEFWIH